LSNSPFFENRRSATREENDETEETAKVQEKIIDQLAGHRVVSIDGLSGCDKSAVLKRFA
jgi:hypothetical protein